MNPRLYRYVTVALLLFSAGPAMPLSTDRDQPMTIEADSVESDDSSGLIIYRGNVDVRQGSMRVTGDTLVIERKDGRISIVTVTGRPATYRQRPDGKEQDVTAQAHELQVYAQQDLITLRKAARIEQDGNLFTGSVIEYDNRNDIIRAKGSSGTGSETGDRVRMTIQPD